MEGLYEQFIHEKQHLLNVSSRTIDGYRWTWKPFEPALRGKTFVDKAAVLIRIAGLKSNGLSAVTVNTYLRSIDCSAPGTSKRGTRRTTFVSHGSERRGRPPKRLALATWRC